MWRDRRILDLFGIDLPVLLAPMAGAGGSELAIAVAEAGGLGSLPCAMLSPEQIRGELGVIRQRMSKPLNLNFFCHTPPQPDPEREAGWRRRLEPYYAEFGLDPDAVPAGTGRNPFNEEACAIVEEYRPEIVSFHFGLPEEPLLNAFAKRVPGSSPPRPPSPRPDGWTSAAATPSSPRAPRPVDIAAFSWRMIFPRSRA